MVLDLLVGDVLTLKKPHACGGATWTVVRLGMDIGITCQQCARRVLLPRSQLERRILRREPAPPAPGSA
jgi:hypothetical protein